jgi:hypothetical protein
MNQEEYATKVKELEDYARHNPESYRLRVGLLAAFVFRIKI